MFATTRVAFSAARKVSSRNAGRRPTSFGAFIKIHKKSPVLAGLSIPQRGRALGKMWRALPAAQKKAIAAKAKTMPKMKARVRKQRKPTAYNLFVKKNMKSVMHLKNTKRFAALSKMFKKAQKAQQKK